MTLTSKVIHILLFLFIGFITIKSIVRSETRICPNILLVTDNRDFYKCLDDSEMKR